MRSSVPVPLGNWTQGRSGRGMRQLPDGSIYKPYSEWKFGTMIGSNEGLIGILLSSGEYIDVPQERVRIVSVEVEKDEKENQESGRAVGSIPQFC